MIVHGLTEPYLSTIHPHILPTTPHWHTYICSSISPLTNHLNSLVCNLELLTTSCLLALEPICQGSSLWQGRIMAPCKMSIFQSPEPVNMSPLLAKGIKLRILRWYYPRLSRWTQCDHKGPYKWKRESGWERKYDNGDKVRESKWDLKTLHYTVGFEDGGRSHELRNIGGLQKREKARKQTVPWSFQWHQPTN